MGPTPHDRTIEGVLGVEQSALEALLLTCCRNELTPARTTSEEHSLLPSVGMSSW